MRGKDKTKDELFTELIDLQNKYSSLQELYETTTNNNKLQEIALTKLKQYTIELSNISPLPDLEGTICRMMKEITGAKAALFSNYNPVQKTLTVQHIEIDSKLLQYIAQLLGKNVKQVNALVSEEQYNQITSEMIGVRDTLFEASFGSVPQPVSTAIQKLLNVDRFIGIAYVLENKLYGTSLLAMSKKQPDPSRQVLENMAFLAAVSLRRKVSEKALKESQTQFSALLEAIPDIMFLQNKEGVYLAYNSSDKSKLYAPPETFIGKSMNEVLPSDIAGDFKRVFKEAVKTKTVQNFEYSLEMPDGKKYFESRTIAYEDDKVLSIIREITERKQYELKIQIQNQELKKLNEDKNRFMSILAHDLKSPFNSILGFLDLLILNIQKYDKEKIEKLLYIIRDSSQHFYQLLESLLVWIRSQSGKMPFEPKNLLFHEVCKHVIEELTLNAKAKKISVDVSTSEIIEVFADYDMLKTILRNLISNAIKFTNEGGKIEIAVEKEVDKVTIIVSDNGLGIEEEKVKTLFDISNRETTLGTAGEQGTGLGLFLCKELIEKHGGNIWVESQYGKGSCFKFNLPNRIVS